MPGDDDVQHDDVFARRGSGFGAGLEVTGLIQAVEDLLDRDPEVPFGDGRDQ